jgi:hypothetical protein
MPADVSALGQKQTWMDRIDALTGGLLFELTSGDQRGTMKFLQCGEFAMPLRRGEVRGFDFNRMVVEFTMLNQDQVIPCAISTAAMDDLEGKRDVKPDQRVDQFMRLREVIEEQASRKFFEEQTRSDRPVILRSNDFSIVDWIRLPDLQV